ncbi:MAG TPA: hypothetical protein VF400_11500 [Anaeromyxobacteraceae bacterium]
MFEPTFIEHRGARILHLDFTGLPLPELVPAFERAHRLILTEPPRSLRIFTMLNSPLTKESAEALKQYGLSNRGLVRASAVVGASFWKVIVTFLQTHGREDLKLFDDEASALDWLAAQ